jgi:hypothetical protein
MADDILVRLPNRITRYRLPRALDRRLHWLLDRNNSGQITAAERLEAEGLADVAELFTLLNLRVERARLEAMLSRKPQQVSANGARRKK